MRTWIFAVLLAACPAPLPPPVAQVTIAPPPPDAAPVPSTTGAEPPQPTLRLPKNFVPTSYAAKLSIDPAQPTFEGSIVIEGDVRERSSVIWLHGRHLAVHRGTASHGDPYATPAMTPMVLTVTPHGEDLLELRTESALEPGTWRLQLDYTGELDTLDTTGAFKEVVAGAPYVYTQFEAIYARRVFPCVDEPDSKVPWKLTLEVPTGQLAVSNTSVERETPIGTGGRRFEFGATKPLPAYLVAFGVGPFDVVPAGTTRTGAPIRMITLKGRGAEAAWAAKTTPQLVALLEDWFDMPYPYAKLDLLTIPMTVGFGAMENAGLITYSERLMLLDPQHASWGRRSRWVATAAHELAHQWFGDLVTMAWWDDIWLNEGFANWMEVKITSKFEPAWHAELGELAMRTSALESDGVISARQVREPIESASDILDVFDGITYDKGASVLAMFESYVGADLFQRGVREYIKAKAYGTATSADFVAAISKVAGRDLAPAFATFLDQPGAPELAFNLHCGPTPTVELSQQRFVAPGSPTPTATRPWIVPVCVAYDNAGKRAEACTLLDGPTGKLALETKTCPRWVMPNVNGRGYYRTRLTSSQVTALRDEAWPLLSWSERRALFFDVGEATRYGRRTRVAPPMTKLPLMLALSFVPKLLTGGDRFTIGDSLGLPLGLDRWIADDQRGKYEAWLRLTFGPGAAKLGMVPKDTDDLDAERSRDDLVSAVAWSGRDPELVKQAVASAQSWHQLPQAMRGSILAVAVDASPELFDKIVADVKTEPDRARRGEMLGALGGVRDPKRFETALALVLDPAIDSRESMSLLFDSSSETTRRVAEQFFRAHKDEILKKVPQDEVTGGFSQATELFTAGCDATRRDELADYVTKTFAAQPGGARVVKQAIESMDQCIASRTLLEPEIRGWLGGVKIPKPTATKRK